MRDVTLYCLCYKDREYKNFQFNQKNIMCGSVNYDINYKKKIQQKNYILDEEGDNISYLNSFFGQLCGLYWSWKNDNSEWVGTNVYRLFWNNYELLSKEKKDNVIYIPKSLDIKDPINDQIVGKKILNLYDQYIFYHGSVGLELLYKVSDTSITPEMIDTLKKQDHIHPYNMFITNRKLYNKLCEILFEILFEFYNKYQYILSDIQKQQNQIRLIDYLSERILHIIYTHKSYFFTGIEFEEISIQKFNYND